MKVKLHKLLTGPITRLLAKTPARGLVTGLVEETTGAIPEPTLADVVEYYRRDPSVKLAVDSLAVRSVGSGFYISVAAGFEALRQRLEEWCDRVALDEVNFRVARDVWLSGNAFLNVVPRLEDPQALYVLPLSSFRRVVRDAGGHPAKYVQQWGGRVRELPADQVLHFRWNPVDESAFGEGLVNHMTRPGVGYRTATGRFRRRPALLEIKERMEDDMQRILHRYLPRHVYSFIGSGVDRRFVDAQVAALRRLEPEEDFVFGGENVEFRVEEVSVNPRARFEYFIQHFENEVLAGLQTPFAKLISTPGFTEASARAAVEFVEPLILMYQRWHKRVVEHHLLYPLVRAAGYDPLKVRPRLHWGQPDRPAFSIGDVLRAGELGFLDREEVRVLLREAGWRLKGEG
jgi:hypothetical protein